MTTRQQRLEAQLRDFIEAPIVGAVRYISGELDAAFKEIMQLKKDLRLLRKRVSDLEERSPNR